MTIERDIERHVRAHAAAAPEAARREHRAHRLVVYGESHTGHGRKAEFLARLFRAVPLRYHASEIFVNTRAYGEAVDAYLRGRSRRAGLPTPLRPFTPVLDVVAADRARRGVVFAGSRANERRHARIHANFRSSMERHRAAGRFTDRAPGQCLLGAEHAARHPFSGTAPTTTQRLERDGLDVGVTRLIVDVPQRPPEPGPEGEGLVFTLHELARVVEIASGREFDLLPILRRAAGGNAIGLSITGSNPFARVRPAGATGSRAFNAYYDAVVFLP